jgi:hypothetical protein
MIAQCLGRVLDSGVVSIEYKPLTLTLLCERRSPTLRCSYRPVAVDCREALYVEASPAECPVFFPKNL